MGTTLLYSGTTTNYYIHNDVSGTGNINISKNTVSVGTISFTSQTYSNGNISFTFSSGDLIDYTGTGFLTVTKCNLQVKNIKS